jgi:hypothetical protein
MTYFSTQSPWRFRHLSLVLWVNICRQHRVLGFANRTTVSCTSATFCNLWPPGRFFRGLKREKSLGAKSVDVWNTPIQTAATRLPSVRLCGVLAPSDFHLFGPLEKHLGGHKCQTDAEVQEAVSQWFCSQNPESCAEGMHSLITHCDKCPNLQDDYTEK